jgi:hypothetical protein
MYVQHGFACLLLIRPKLTVYLPNQTKSESVHHVFSYASLSLLFFTLVCYR